MTVPPRGRSPRFALSAAGFIATSTVGASPGVTTVWSAKCSWNADTPGSVPAGARISGELHAVPGVTGEPDDHLGQRLDRLARGHVGHRVSPGSWLLAALSSGRRSADRPTSCAPGPPPGS